MVSFTLFALMCFGFWYKLLIEHDSTAENEFSD